MEAGILVTGIAGAICWYVSGQDPGVTVAAVCGGLIGTGLASVICRLIRKEY